MLARAVGFGAVVARDWASAGVFHARLDCTMSVAETSASVVLRDECEAALRF